MRLVGEELACVRGGRTLFQALTFRLSAGEALAVTGPNGSGKSSFLRILAGLLPPAAGRFALEGGGPDASPATAAHLVGHLDALKGALTAAENLEFQRGLFGGGGVSVEQALERLGIGPLATLPAHMLSAGQRRRLALARLLVAPRPIWLLDEPMTALDADGQETVAALAAEHLAGGGAVAAATHATLPFARAEIRLGGAMQ